jgi:hypothetical protein
MSRRCRPVLGLGGCAAVPARRVVPGLWPYCPAEQVHAGEAMFLLPSDTGLIIKVSNLWIMKTPVPRAPAS